MNNKGALSTVAGLIIVMIIILFFLAQYTEFGHRIKEQLFGLTEPYTGGADGVEGDHRAEVGSLERDVPMEYVNYAKKFTELLFEYDYEENKFPNGQLFVIESFKKGDRKYRMYEIRLLKTGRGVEVIVYNTKNDKQYSVGSAENDYTQSYLNFELCVLPINRATADKSQYAGHAISTVLGISYLNNKISTPSDVLNPLSSDDRGDIYASAIHFPHITADKPSQINFQPVNSDTFSLARTAHTGEDSILFYQYDKTICVFPTWSNGVDIKNNVVVGTGSLDDNLLSKMRASYRSNIVYRS